MSKTRNRLGFKTRTSISVDNTLLRAVQKSFADMQFSEVVCAALNNFIASNDPTKIFANYERDRTQWEEEERKQISLQRVTKMESDQGSTGHNLKDTVNNLLEGHNV